MGRSASHIALECALETQPNICLISEEIQEKGLTLDEIVTDIAQVVAARAAEGNNFGTVLIPEGLIEFIPSIKRLIAELNDVLSSEAYVTAQPEDRIAWLLENLSQDNAATLASLPRVFADQLTGERDPHGNVQV